MSDLVRNMRAGSMLTEAMRPTWRISLAIILSFSKFTRPSTLESLPEKFKGKKDQLHKRGWPRSIFMLML